MVIDKHDYVAIELGHDVYYNSLRSRSYGSHKHKLSREYLWVYLWKYLNGLYATVSVCNIECLHQIKINKHTSPIRPIQSNIPNNYVFSLFLYLMHE